MVLLREGAALVTGAYSSLNVAAGQLGVYGVQTWRGRAPRTMGRTLVQSVAAVRLRSACGGVGGESDGCARHEDVQDH